MKVIDSTTLDKNASKRVSFIIMTKNKAEYLQKALERHRELIKPDDELIIVDGGSTDNTPTIVNQYADMVDIFISEPDVSPGHALSKGMLISHGKYIKQISDDDLIHAEGMEKAVQVMEIHPEIDLLVCGGTRQIKGKTTPFCLPNGINYGSSVTDVFQYGSSGIGFVIRRSAIPLIGLYPTSIVDDKEFALNAIRNGANIKFCRINLFHHVIHDHSAVKKQEEAHKKYNNQLAKQYCSRRFYYQYRLDSLLGKYLLYRLLKKPSIVIEFLRREGISEAIKRILLRKKPTGSPAKVKEPVWDGGFS